MLALERQTRVGDIDNPTFINFDPSLRCRYANSEVFGWKEGTVGPYAFDAATGSLRYLNRQIALGSIST